MINSHLAKDIAIIGYGSIGREYSKILESLNKKHSIISRSSDANESSNIIKSDLFDMSLADLKQFNFFIICVQPDLTFDVLQYILENTNALVMVEKPIALCTTSHKKLIKEFNRIFVALNRRKFLSAKEFKEKNLCTSELKVICEVTEIESRKEGTKKNIDYWPIANTLHVIDMALYLSGTYSYLDTEINIEKGAGFLKGRVHFNDINQEILFYDCFPHTGNWGIDIASDKGKFIFRPLETLQFQKKDSMLRSAVDLIEEEFKDGFYDNVKDFLLKKRQSFISYEEYDFLIKIIAYFYNLK